MKAKFFALLAVVLAVVSCQKDVDNLDVNMGGDVATISVTLPADAITRAAADETDSAWSGLQNVKGETLRVIFQVYDENGVTNEGLRQTTTLSEGELTANFNVRLVPGRKYTFVAWADQGEQYFDVADLKNVKLLSWEAMDECRDAFTATHTEDDFTSSSNITLELIRPFAKLRVVTTDMAELGLLNITPNEAEVEYTVALPNAFNAFAGEACATTASKSFTNFEIAEYNKDAANTMTLFTDYILVPADKVVKFSLKTMQDGGRKIKENNFNTDIPVERNNLTTIKGNILTDGNDIDVVVKPEFGGETEWPNTPAGELAKAAMFGGEFTLTEDVVLTDPLNVTSKLTINLNGKTISTTEREGGRHHYAIDNYGTLTIKGNGAINARGIENFGTMTIDGNIVITNVDTNGGAAIWNEGDLTINDGTFKTNDSAVEGSYGAALNTRANGKAVVNGGTFEAYSQLTYAVINEGETVIYNATVKGKHGAVCGAETNDNTTIYGGSFELIENPGVSDHCTYYVSAIYGGSFSLGNNTDSGAKVFYESNMAPGYKAIAADGVYYVLPETIVNAAEAEGVTAVTESTADVATALATNNGEATLFMWNDVAYIAKYGEVVITSAADEATTVRGVVESLTGLTSATVADGIEVVGNRTFRKCANLETVALPNTLTEIGPAVFQSCSKLANITIPESVTTIGEGAFAECTALTSINIPAGITRLEKDVLRNTGLVSVEIPASVNYIGTYAFRDCESLTEIKILSPEFTIETNTFTNMAAPVPTMTIHVVNDEMKAYLESTLTNYDKSYITVVGPTSVSNAEELKDAVTEKYAIVNVPAGEYTFPSSVAAGVTIVCEEGTVFTGTSGLNINGATVIGATFQSGSNGLVANQSKINGTYKNCVFNGDLYYSIAGDTVVFENCVFNGPDYALHFDTGVANSHVILRGCEVNSEWRVAIGATVSMFEAIDTNFNVEGFINLWGKAKFTNCAFNKPYYWICCMDTTEFTNCTCENRALVANDIRIEDTVITIDGVIYE